MSENLSLEKRIKEDSHIKQFAADVNRGLTSTPKKISSQYLYDQTGDALFQEIMGLDEYYLSRSEHYIITQYRDEMTSLFYDGNSFDIVEFGAGDGVKTKILLDHLTAKKVDFNYFPVDISGNALMNLICSFKHEIPGIKIEGIRAEYFTALNRIKEKSNNKRIFLFLGANIGNLTYNEANTFLKKLHDCMNQGDMIMIGFDLKKDPSSILAAYKDSKGITRKFNMNLLERINKELDGKFSINCFEHYPTYDPLTGECKSFLVSKKEQKVYIGQLNKFYFFDQWETIQTELSLKYSTEDMLHLADSSGFKVVENYSDENKCFVDSIWVKL